MSAKNSPRHSKKNFAKHAKIFDAAGSGNVKKLDSLLNNCKVDLSEVLDADGATVFMIACLRGQLAVLEYLLAYPPQKGGGKRQLFDVNAEGCTALICAVNEGHAHLLPLLVSSGSDTNHSTNLGSTPLMHACSNGHVACVAALMKHCPTLDTRSRDGWTALHHAANGGFVEVVGLLLRAGANPNILTNDGLTALHCAASWSHTSVVGDLVRSGADLNVKNVDGCTALVLAAARGHLPTVAALLEGGASPFVAEKSGALAVDVALRRKHFHVVTRLKAAMNADGLIDRERKIAMEKKKLVTDEENERAQREADYDKEVTRIKTEVLNKNTREELLSQLSTRRQSSRVRESMMIKQLSFKAANAAGAAEAAVTSLTPRSDTKSNSTTPRELPRPAPRAEGVIGNCCATRQETTVGEEVGDLPKTAEQDGLSTFLCGCAFR